MKHTIRKSSKAIRKAQSVFLRGVVFPAIEEARQAFAGVERVPYMPEIQEAGESPEYMEMYNWGDR